MRKRQNYRNLKFSVFIILVILFIASFYIWAFTDKIQDFRLVGVTGIPIRLFVLIPIIIMGLINLLILLKSTRIYTYIFFSLVAITVVFHIGNTLREINQRNEDRKAVFENSRNSQVIDSAWININTPKEVLKKLEAVKSSTRFIINEKAAVYFALAIKNETFEVYFQNQTKEIYFDGCRAESDGNLKFLINDIVVHQLNYQDISVGLNSPEKFTCFGFWTSSHLEADYIKVVHTPF